MATLLITGGAGFIGCNLVRHGLAHTADRIVVVDKLTYAGNLLNLEEPLTSPRVAFVRADIADRVAMARVFREARPDAGVIRHAGPRLLLSRYHGVRSVGLLGRGFVMLSLEEWCFDFYVTAQEGPVYRLVEK